VLGLGQFLAAGVHPTSWAGSSSTHQVCREKQSQQQLLPNVPKNSVAAAAFSNAMFAFDADIRKDARLRITRNPSLHNYTFVHVNESSLEEGAHPNMLLVKELLGDASNAGVLEFPEFYIEVPPTGEEMYVNGALRQFTRQMGRALGRSVFGAFLLFLRSRALARF